MSDITISLSIKRPRRILRQVMKHLCSNLRVGKPSRRVFCEWRNIPRDNGLSPAQWLIGRRLRTSIPATSSAYERITEKTFSEARYKKEKIKDLSTLIITKNVKNYRALTWVMTLSSRTQDPSEGVEREDLQCSRKEAGGRSSLERIEETS
ncbi:Uncharacterized protein FKW44_006743 [Caligus rogercresseyi]|uniref:Uncharacterized protein n=1 Tax=Caligus rogercresseyi TaxID=217165 RepID=A0A7T8QT20_CALRO|nr:Uncharacterized protein FKW44_006743 [Caligus rogercresseyi]